MTDIASRLEAVEDERDVARLLLLRVAYRLGLVDLRRPAPEASVVDAVIKGWLSNPSEQTNRAVESDAGDDGDPRGVELGHTSERAGTEHEAPSARRMVGP